MNPKTTTVLFTGTNYGIIEVTVDKEKVGEIKAIENSDGFSIGREFTPEPNFKNLYNAQITETFETNIALFVRNVMLVHQFPTKIELSFVLIE